VRAPGGQLVKARGKVVQIVSGRAIAVALEDAAGAKAALAPLFASARSAPPGGDGSATATWVEAAEAAEGEAVAEGGPETPEDADLHQRIKEMPTVEKMKLAVHGDRSARMLLMKDTNKTLQTFVLQNKRITLEEVRFLAGFRQAHPDVLVTIAGNRDWTANPAVVAALVRNPKTPSPTAVKLLDKLPIAELRRLAKSNDVPRPVTLAARKKAVDA